MFNKSLECINKAELKSLQLERIKETLRLIYDNVDYYKQKMDECNISTSDINSLEDIKKLPFTTKDDLKNNYPFNSFAAPMRDIVRIHSSSNMKKITSGFTKGDIEAWSHCCARSIGCAGTNRDVVQISYDYGFANGLGLHYGAEKLGATTIPISSGEADLQTKLMQDYGTTILCSTSDYALRLAQEKQKDSNLRIGIFGAESHNKEQCEYIEKLWGIDVLNIYGPADIIGPGVAMECIEEKNGMHVWEDNFIVEIIDPVSGECLEDGEIGELVITTINRSGMPIIRYRTNDLTYIIDKPCSCGRTHKKIGRLQGRTDDMLTIHGVNIYPSQFEELIAIAAPMADEYQIIIERINHADKVNINVELTEKILSDEVRKIEKVRDDIQRILKDSLKLDVKVNLVAPTSIKDKQKRLIDNRF